MSGASARAAEPDSGRGIVKGIQMATGEKSLRRLVEKWFGRTPAMPARVTRYSHAVHGQRRFVRVEAVRDSGALAIFFFRHDDGSWCVFPPATKGPSMRSS